MNSNLRGFDVNFAYRFSQISSPSPWVEVDHISHSRPPSDWRRDGSRGWHAWRAGFAPDLPDDEVEPHGATSIIWCQSQQAFWILLGDCVGWQEEDQDPACGWHRLYLQDLAKAEPPRKHLWKLVHYGLIEQHDSTSLPTFREFLPGSFFKGSSSTRCHLVGDLSLVLGLMAMIPAFPDLIVRQIDEYFFHDDSPRFISCSEHRQWKAMDKAGELPIPILPPQVVID